MDADDATLDADLFIAEWDKLRKGMEQMVKDQLWQQDELMVRFANRSREVQLQYEELANTPMRHESTMLEILHGASPKNQRWTGTSGSRPELRAVKALVSASPSPSEWPALSPAVIMLSASTGDPREALPAEPNTGPGKVRELLSREVLPPSRPRELQLAQEEDELDDGPREASGLHAAWEIEPAEDDDGEDDDGEDGPGDASGESASNDDGAGPPEAQGKLRHRNSWEQEFGQQRIQEGRKMAMTKHDMAHEEPQTQLARFLQRWNTLEEPVRHGRLADFIQSKWFDVGVNVSIFLTTAYTGWVANYQAETLDPDLGGVGVVLLGFLLAIIYIVEVILRMSVHRVWFFVNEDASWNVFDFCLASCEVMNILSRVMVEMGFVKLTFLRSLRILRISRLLRVFKLITGLNVLRLLLDTMLASVMTVMWCGVVFVFSLAIFALMFVQLVADARISGNIDCGEVCTQRLVAHFGSVPRAMLSLFMATTGGNDWSMYFEDLSPVGPGASTSFVLFNFIFQFGVFNLLTAIFVDRAMKSSKPDIDLIIVEQRRAEVEEATRLKNQFKNFDADHDGTLCLREFKSMLHDKAMSSFLAAVGLDIQDAEVFFQTLCEISECDEIPIDTFVQGCMRMKGTASSLDMQALIFEVRLLSKNLREVHNHMDQQTKDLGHMLEEHEEEHDQKEKPKTFNNPFLMTPKRTGSEDVCVCGNVCMPDANFCRRCGAKRKGN